MRIVVWSQAARDDYLAILRFIAADDPDAAKRVVDAIEATGNALGAFATGHPGRVAGIYEKSVRGMPYIVAYALTGSDTTVSILRVIHTARDWQDDGWPE